MTEQPRVCVVGAGAVGGLIAARLALFGYPISVVGKTGLGLVRRQALSLGLDESDPGGQVG